MSEIFNTKERELEKVLSRQQDAADLNSGNKTREQLTKENGVFSQFNCKPNFLKFLNR